MAYQAPTTKSTGTLITAAIWNQDVVDNQNAAFPLGVGAWTTWIPTWTNLTIGNAVVTAKYQRVGRLITFRLKVVLGTTSSVGTAPIFTLPVTAHADYAGEFPLGPATYADTGTKVWEAFCQLNNTTTAFLRHSDGASAFTNTTATAPFTWTTNDIINAIGTYEAAS